MRIHQPLFLFTCMSRPPRRVARPQRHRSHSECCDRQTSTLRVANDTKENERTEKKEEKSRASTHGFGPLKRSSSSLICERTSVVNLDARVEGAGDAAQIPIVWVQIVDVEQNGRARFGRGLATRCRLECHVSFRGRMKETPKRNLRRNETPRRGVWATGFKSEAWEAGQTRVARAKNEATSNRHSTIQCQ